MIKRPLGRGLSALISTDPLSAASDEIREIETDLIKPGQQQPRTSFDPARLDELAQSIRTTGIIQPLLVRRSAASSNWSQVRGVGARRKSPGYPGCRRSFEKSLTIDYSNWH